MRREVHTRRATLVLAALAMAAAYPITLPLSREHTASAEVVVTDAAATASALVGDTAATMPIAAFTSTSGRVSDAGQTASMLLVGTLLIGIGSVVRRVA